MTTASAESERNTLLAQMLQVLRGRGLTRKWAESQTPYSDLLQECELITSSDLLLREFGGYLRANPVIQFSVDSLLAHLSSAAFARWQDVPMPAQLFARRGWHLGRWLPTFLVIDAPLARFLRDPESPLNALLRGSYMTYPTLAQARDVFGHDLYRRLRNGIGHWSFAWEHNGGGERLVCFDWQSGERTVDVSLLEAEGLHLVSFSTIECLDYGIFRRANPQYGG